MEQGLLGKWRESRALSESPQEVGQNVYELESLLAKQIASTDSAQAALEIEREMYAKRLAEMAEQLEELRLEAAGWKGSFYGMVEVEKELKAEIEHLKTSFRCPAP